MGEKRLRQDVVPLSLRGIVDLMLEGLTPAQLLALKGRFGLWDGKKRTLEEIGKCLSNSRQRVFQLVQEAEKRLREQYKEKEALAWFVKAKEKLLPSLLASCEGLATREELAELVLSSGGRGHARLALGFLQSLFQVDSLDLFSDWKKDSTGIYFVDESTQRKFGITESCLEAILSEKEAPMAVPEVAHVVNRRLGFRTPLKWLRRCAEVSKTVGLDKMGSVGLRRWKVFAPKTVSEMTQRALMEIGRPAHMSKIIEKMKIMFPERDPFSEGSVHNVLASETGIFIPARRGVYGLSSWKIRRAPKIKNFLVEAIKQNGGTARVEDLIAEGSAKYGFRTSSVRSVLRDKAAFVQVSSEGIVKLVP